MGYRKILKFWTLLVAGIICAPLATLHSEDASTPKAAMPVEHFSPLIEKLLSEMSVDEKISLLSGTKEPVYAGQAAYSAGLPKYGIPSMRWADGQGGINGAQDATTLPPWVRRQPRSMPLWHMISGQCWAATHVQ
jgi:hypothetical protein